MMQISRMVFAAFLLSAFALPATAEDEKWHVGQHPDYHVALVKQVDEVFVAIYVSKEPSKYMSPVLMETILAPCGEEKPISLHSTKALMVLGETLEERMKVVRENLESFFERGQGTCNLAADLEQRFFNRFEDAYAATDVILVEAGIFPLSDPFAATEELDDGNVEKEND